MNAPRFAEHNGIKILVLSFGKTVLYVFQKGDDWFMQFTEVPVKLWDRILSWFGKPLEMRDITEVENAMIGAAKRSIEMIDDPNAKFCEHDIVTEGKNAMLCASCSKIKKEYDDLGKKTF